MPQKIAEEDEPIILIPGPPRVPKLIMHGRDLSDDPDLRGKYPVVTPSAVGDTWDVVDEEPIPYDKVTLIVSIGFYTAKATVSRPWDVRAGWKRPPHVHQATIDEMVLEGRKKALEGVALDFTYSKPEFKPSDLLLVYSTYVNYHAGLVARGRLWHTYKPEFSLDYIMTLQAMRLREDS
ncbi:hypothetical protein KY361_06620 [Candidatus Woesearchaeota archaeon]|nr:hypothetical protein [Candidatus Woesearchaeota archaeon]